MLDEMLATYVQLGKIDRAREYLDNVKNTFSKYGEWDRILNVHKEVDKKGLGKVVKMVLDNEFEGLEQ